MSFSNLFKPKGPGRAKPIDMGAIKAKVIATKSINRGVHCDDAMQARTDDFDIADPTETPLTPFDTIRNERAKVTKFAKKPSQGDGYNDPWETIDPKDNAEGPAR